MASEQPDQQSNTAIKSGLWIRLYAVILGPLMAGAAAACSCSQVGVENLVLDKRLSLAKIVVGPPTFTDRIADLLGVFKKESLASKTYSVKVMEVITGRYDATAIQVKSSGSSDCGVDLRYGQTYYHIVNLAATREPVHASACNLVNEEYVRQVKAYKQRPKPELSPVPPGSWTEIFRDSNDLDLAQLGHNLLGL
ncbi:MAG: hypothetical protein FJY42_13035 [Betaproteobacteria bacterium]|nr:hypothetical protein [Betaproteobacteria bacterium]